MKKLVSYKGIKTGIGLATNCYKQVLEKQEISLKDLIIQAAERGFSWVEVRDPEVMMSIETLKTIKKIADSYQIRIHYSWDNGNVFEEDERFYEGMRRAVMFGKGTCCRVLIAAQAIAGKKGYSEEEMNKIIHVLKLYIKTAKELEIFLCFENSMEPIKGDGKTYFGMEDILLRLPEMSVTFDAANFTTETTVINPMEAELISYYQKFSKRIFYYHMKQTRNHKLIPALEDHADFDVIKLMKMFAKTNPDTWVCLEIPQQKDLNRMNEMVEKSILYLERKNKDEDGRA
ncbi:MAG: TIM barrel protein [Hespellia sp.]|nr:TIM barrel protein [Hespellia sp.]